VVFGISGLELLIIVLFVLLIFGPDKIPELSRTLGKAMRMFKRAQEDMEKVIRAEVYSPAGDNDSAAATDHTEIKEEVQQATKAATIWASTEEDDEEEDEE
jgi:TatA/E family protein of Tat protein translocase